MRELASSRRLVVLVAVSIVVFAFWRALFAGGSLVSHDIVATAAPFDAAQPEGFTLENGPGDPINIHAHWAPLASVTRSGDVGWWNPALAGGQPTMKAGLPVFNLLYLVVPSWFAPGLVAAVRTLVALGLTAGFLRSVDVGRLGALAGGLAFAFSGFMVGWMNWPHSSVAALAPGLLWAIERAITDPRPRRAVPIALAGAAMVWANFPQVTLYVLLGGAVYAAIRLAGEHGATIRNWRAVGPVALVGVLATGLALGLAAPHLIGFSEYLDWADTSHRGLGPDDSSAGAEYLLTAVAPAIWGSDAVGVPWFGHGNWVEFNAHAGASVVLLALSGLALGLGTSGRRRHVVVALATIGTLGILIAYVGGPIGVFFGDIAGDRGGLMTRAKVLVSLALAMLAGFGVDGWARSWDEGDRARLGRSLVTATVLLVVVTMAMLPSARHWFQVARAQGTVKESLATATVPLLAMVAVVVVIAARWRRWLGGTAAGWALVAIVGIELLFFAMPVPTTVSRAERLSATPAHETVSEALQVGERLAGEGRTFFPNTTAHYGIDDARGQVLKSPGYQALLRLVDPNMLTVIGGGTPTYPNIGIDTDPAHSTWDALAVGVWAQFPTSTPPGVLVKPPFVTGRADPTLGPVTGQFEVPDGGLRAVVLDVAIPHRALVTVTVDVAGQHFEDRRWRDPSDWFLMPVALLGEDLPVSSPVTVTINASPQGAMMVAVGDDGAAVAGTIAGGDKFRLLRTGDVLLSERLDAEFVRVVGAAIVAPDLATAVNVIGARSGSSPAAVSKDVGLPVAPVVDAELEVDSIKVGRDRAQATVLADRDALVVFAINNYPGWRASVDGTQIDIVTADATFIGVPVGPGQHLVEVEFRPRHLISSLLLFLGAAAATFALWAIDRRRRSGVEPVR